MNGPSRLMAYVHACGDEGPILSAVGAFVDELKNAGYDVSDHDMPKPDVGHVGLLVFEGWVDVGPGDDPDVSLVGSWRRLTHWEMCRVTFGLSPFAEGGK